MCSCKHGYKSHVNKGNGGCMAGVAFSGMPMVNKTLYPSNRLCTCKKFNEV